MKDKLADHDFEGISALIKKEEEDALAFFRAGNFRPRLEARLRETAGEKKQAVLVRRMAVPVLAAALALIMAGIFFFVLKRPGAGPLPEFKALASALAQLPGFSHPPGRDRTASLQKPRTSLLAEAVRQALVQAEDAKRNEEQIIFVPAGKGKVPRLSLDQKMEILFQEKAIERALLFFTRDSKEV